MKRDNLFRSVKAGGLALMHLFLSQIVSRFIFFRDQEGPISRTVIQTQLGAFMPGFIVSTYENVSTCLFGYLKEVVDSVAFLVVAALTKSSGKPTTARPAPRVRPVTRPDERNDDDHREPNNSDLICPADDHAGLPADATSSTKDLPRLGTRGRGRLVGALRTRRSLQQLE